MHELDFSERLWRRSGLCFSRFDGNLQRAAVWSLVYRRRDVYALCRYSATSCQGERAFYRRRVTRSFAYSLNRVNRLRNFLSAARNTLRHFLPCSFHKSIRFKVKLFHLLNPHVHILQLHRNWQTFSPTYPIFFFFFFFNSFNEIKIKIKLKFIARFEWRESGSILKIDIQFNRAN